MISRTLLLLAMLAAVSRGQTWVATVWHPDKDGFGTPVLLVDDLDGDGVADVVAHDTLEPGGPLSHEVLFLAGDDLAPLFSVAGAPYEQLGAAMASLGDIDGDGVPEIAASARFDTPPNHNGPQPGMVRVLSGANGSVVHQLVGTTSDMGLGSYLASAGDIDGDGLQDLLASAGKPGPTTRIYSTGTWQPIESFPGLGPSMTPGDIDLDGVPDIAVVQLANSTIPIFSGADGRVLITIAKPGAQGFGTSVSAMGDLDDDGIPDIAVGAPANGGSARTISCATGQDLVVTWGWSSFPAGNYGQSVSSAGDIDGDGHADLLVGAPDTYVTLNPITVTGLALIRSSATGNILARFERYDFVDLGRFVVGGRDLTGDGFPDLALSSSDTFDGNHLCIASARLRVTELLPTEAPASQPTQIALHGGGFQPGSPVQVTVGGVAATSASCVSPTLVEFITPIGPEDSVNDVVVTQDGLSVVIPKGLSLVGPEILDVYPPVIPKTGGTLVTVVGTNFPVDGSAAVNFHAGAAAIQAIGSKGAVVIAPPFTPGAAWDVQVAGSTGSGTSANGAFKYSDRFASPNRGNISGGTTVVLAGLQANHAAGAPVVTVGSPTPCQILAITPTTMTVVTPARLEADGSTSDFMISDPLKGNEGVTAKFLYTPYLKATWTKAALAGGRIRLQWFTDPAAVQPQLVTAWAGVPGSASFSQSFPAFAGVLHVAPWEFVSLLQPLPQPLAVMDFQVPVYDPLAIGLTLSFQSHVTGEGPAKGSLSNFVTLTLN